RVSFELVDHLKCDRVAFEKMNCDGIHSADSGGHNHRALRKEVTRNPGSADKALDRALRAAPGWITISSDEDQDAFFVRHMKVGNQQMARLQYFKFNLYTDRISDINGIRYISSFSSHANSTQPHDVVAGCCREVGPFTRGHCSESGLQIRTDNFMRWTILKNRSLVKKDSSLA